MKNQLNVENCNKSKCKSCLFGPTPIQLTPERLEEIHGYLSRFESSYICHTTNKTCYGGMELQAKILYSLKLLPDPTVGAFLKAAKIALEPK